MPSRIEDYALIGDLQTVALVDMEGSIDWLCLPRFDSGACFAALLGDEENGRWMIAPLGDVVRRHRCYRPGTLVLETETETSDGLVRVTDCMTPRNGEADVIRVVEGLRGQVRMRMSLTIRFDYGSRVPWVRRLDGDLIAIAGPDALCLRTSVETRGEGATTVAEFVVREGERVSFRLIWFSSHTPPPERVDAMEQIASTDQWWQEWSGRYQQASEYRDAELRSLITLKSLTYLPTGGIVAAPTTSLPEKLGGVRNWDYRYCWIRDASLTLSAFTAAGFTEEAAQWEHWLLRAVAGDPAQMQIMYGIAGERQLPEREIPWLAGYEGASPVRVGNAASEQFQLDVYGELLEAGHEAMRAGIGDDPDVESWPLFEAIVGFVIEHWRDPDEGIWEIRGPREHFTHSKVMAWVALDRAIRMAEDRGGSGAPASWRAARDEIHADVCRKGYDRSLGSFTRSYGSPDVDASLLLLPLVGFLPATDPRIQGTIDEIQRRLCSGPHVFRYAHEESADGLPPGEGAFFICSFWLVSALARSGRVAEARHNFDQLLALRNDVGLLSEEFDLHERRLVGNFPQAFSHVGLINAARDLSHAVAGSWAGG